MNTDVTKDDNKDNISTIEDPSKVDEIKPSKEESFKDLDCRTWFVIMDLRT